jgi:hypothetical protein
MTAPRSLRRAWLVALLTGHATALADAAVEVWVDLSEPVAAISGNPEEAAQRRQRVERQQAAVAAELQRLGAVELARLRHTRNAIAVRIAPDRLDAVRGIPGVLRVRPAHELHPPELLPPGPTKREPR